MLTIHAIPGRNIVLGREGENLARSVIFDVSDWISAYGDGTVNLIAQRSGDTEPYPCTVTVDGSSVTWLVTAADTARQGYGKCELRYAVGDVLVKSETWLTYTADALGTPAPEAPEPQKAWVDKVLEAGQAAVDASVNSPKVGDNGNWFVWDFEAGAYVDTGVKASGGDIVRIELADYGLYFGGEGVSVPQELIDILRDALDNRKAPYVHGAVEEGIEGTVLLDTMYVMNGVIFATGVGVLVLDGVTPAWFALYANPEALTVSTRYGLIAGEDGYSPTIDVSRGENKTILTITDLHGPKTVEIPDGKDGAVSSVNGKTGDVTLTAGDVGAVSVPATASVGQTIVVKAVDADGVPTAWEAVDVAKPWGWELINEITIPEGADEILEFVINTDSNGKPFKLHRFMMFVHLPIYTGGSEIPSYGYGVINGHKYNDTTYSAPLIYTAPSEPSKNDSSTFSWMEGDIMGDGNHMCIYGRYNPGVLSNGGFVITTGVGGMPPAAKFRYITGVPQSLYDVYRPITSVGLSGILMFAGCKVWLYGTRVQEDKA